MGNNRDNIIVRTSIIGIIANIFLAAVKALIGLAVNSIAIVLDAVNNFSDASSSLITIIGTKLAKKEPDRDHPYGYGRIEYLTEMVISLIILYAGFNAFARSVENILNPTTPEYNTTSLIIVSIGVIVKLFLGGYVKSVGEKVNSDSLVNSGEDARFDAIISASTLVSAIIFIKFGLSLEAYLGVLISIFIIKSGIEMIRGAISRVLGENASFELIRNVKKTISSFDDVSGAYDLALNNYGPDRYTGSVHIEIPEDYTAAQLDVLTRKITDKVLEEYDIALTGVSVYAVNNKDKKISEIRNAVYNAARSVEYVLQVHGFYLDEDKKEIRFDAVVSFDAKSRKEVRDNIIKEIKKIYPEYDAHIQLDIDFSSKKTD